MKKIIVALLTVLLVFAFCGCENTTGDETSLNAFHITKCYDNGNVRILDMKKQAFIILPMILVVLDGA